MFISLLRFSSDFVICQDTQTDTLYAGGNGLGNYSTIQDAINASANGDTVFVYNGTYYENIKVEKSIILLGKNRDTTIIDGSEFHNVNQDTVILLTDNATISGFTIKNGLNGINIEGSNNSIKDNIFQNNLYGLFLFNSSSNDIINNNFRNNSIIGIKLEFLSNNNIIYHNNFINNTQHASDECNNTWHNIDLSQGNYWDNYSGSDKNNNGLGDTPYQIPGGDNEDEYPIKSPYYGRIVLEEFYVDTDAVIYMLEIGIVSAIVFSVPIAIYLYLKRKKMEK
jgi:parallel beta-helix repeat protein